MRSLSKAAFEDFAEAAPHGRRFCFWHWPHRHPSALIVHVHAFGEEMNKSRRMVALQSRALAEAGACVLQVDLLGCGDSDGDFADASWEAWLSDVIAACGLVRDRHAQLWPGVQLPPLWLWGMRVGCLLASQAADRMAEPCDLLFWQPTMTGSAALQQFLRLKLTSNMSQPDSRALADDLRRDLATNQPVEVAGYRLASGLASGLQHAELVPVQRPSRVLWLEVRAHEESHQTPVAQVAAERWRQAGHQVVSQSVVGPAFWSTVEVTEVPELVATSTRLLLESWRS